jgi:hypothetical protein
MPPSITASNSTIRAIPTQIRQKKISSKTTSRKARSSTTGGPPHRALPAYRRPAGPGNRGPERVTGPCQARPRRRPALYTTPMSAAARVRIVLRRQDGSARVLLVPDRTPPRLTLEGVTYVRVPERDPHGRPLYVERPPAPLPERRHVHGCPRCGRVALCGGEPCRVGIGRARTCPACGGGPGGRRAPEVRS